MDAGGSMQEHQFRPAEGRNGVSSVHSIAVISQRVCLVQRFALFSNVTPSECAQVLALAHEKEFSRRQSLFFEGDPVRQIILLTTGCVKVTQFGPNGSEVILRLAGPGEMVATNGSLSGGLHCSTAQALQASRALIWDVPAFEALSERIPALRRNTVNILCRRLNELEDRFREVSTQKVAPRLGSQLLRLVNQVGRRVEGAVEICLSQEELAQLTGTTLFTVSRVLSQWEQLGIVNTRREAVLVRDVQALSGLSEAG
jgi:CRP-like cAMP-binding protein